MALVIKPVTIASGQSLSGAINIPQESTLVGIAMPAAWDTATLTFQGGVTTGTSTTFRNMYAADGTEFQSDAIASAHIAIDPVDFAGVVRLKVRSGTSGTAVAQTADRILTLVFEVD